MAGDTQPKPLFRDITADEDVPEITELESLCVTCMQQGTTRLFLTKIPFFKEVIVSSFTCDHCGYHNAELQSGGRIQDKGVCYTCKIITSQDLNRQVVQTEYATIHIPVLEFEVPPKKGVLTTVEGILTTAVEDLDYGQPVRRVEAPEIAAKIDEFVIKLKGLLTLQEPFEFVLDDPSGNSFLENLHAPNKDPEMKIVHYTRTKQQDVDLCIIAEDEQDQNDVERQNNEEEEVLGTKESNFNTQNEVLHFNTNCPQCNTPCETNMKLINIPFFKEVVIMATTCEACGHRDNEVKSGGGIEVRGRKITLLVQNVKDMTRDVLKSETCSVLIPELEFETDIGTLGGKFTTIEGLLEDFKGQLKGNNPFVTGDSHQQEIADKLKAFCDKLDQIIQGELSNVHIILDDPAGNSYVQSLMAPDPDSQLSVEDYERNFEQNEVLGLNDMKTEGYEENR